MVAVTSSRTGRWRRRTERAAREPRDYRHLPDRVDPAEMVTTQPAEEERDPRGGRDTETDFLLRHAGPL